MNNDPEVKAAWAKWADADLLIEQIKNSKSVGPVVLAPWYGEFQIKASQLLQQAVTGSLSISDALTQAADYVNSKL